jgi:uncharacterized membrane protein YhhN
MQKQHVYLLAFIAISITNLIAVAFDIQWLIFLTKPLLIPSLALWFHKNIISIISPAKLYFLMGLYFSTIGDILLMLVNVGGEVYFLLGLGSFLIAHICYIMAFVKYSDFKKGAISKKKLLLAPFMIFLIGTVIFLWDGLGELRIPVLIYASVIISMAAFCFNLKNRVSEKSFLFLFSGALLFVISDFAIAIVKFNHINLPHNISGIIIMTTYLLGQFGLTNGMVKAIK